MTKKILVLAANPTDTDNIRLDREVREIDNGLERARRRDEFILKQKWAARPADVRRAMLDFEPNIVHFCGHGSGEAGIAFEDETEQTKLVNADTLAEFFKFFADKLECVVLNACYSVVQAEAVAKHIPYVVGMKQAIGDTAAIEFSVAFYDALGAGKSIEFAFDLACNAIQWAGKTENLTPILIIKPPLPPPPPPPDTRPIIKPIIIPPPPPPEPTIPFDWVVIPAGEFLMGNDRSQDQDAEGNELPQHPVDLPEYRIARVSVTVAQFRRFIGATHYKTTAERQGGARDLKMGSTRDDWPRKEGAYWEHPHGPGSYAQETHPVTCISWYDAVEFCKWAGVRLPTEAEWEKAAGWDRVHKVKRIYPWGNELPDKNRCNAEMQVGDTTPVDRYPAGATPDGILDMAGNVWEWTSSIYKEYPYKADDCEDPQSTGERVLRGGSFYQEPRYVRCAHRIRHRPDALVSDYGFRVCAM